MKGYFNFTHYWFVLERKKGEKNWSACSRSDKGVPGHCMPYCFYSRKNARDAKFRLEVICPEYQFMISGIPAPYIIPFEGLVALGKMGNRKRKVL